LKELTLPILFLKPKHCVHCSIQHIQHFCIFYTDN